MIQIKKFSVIVYTLLCVLIFTQDCFSQRKLSRSNIYSAINKVSDETCGLIQVLVFYDNNCNGIFDIGDSYASGINVMLTSSSLNEQAITSVNGTTFFSNLNSSSYSTNISVPNGWSVNNQIQTVNIYHNPSDRIQLINYPLCKSCDCGNFTGVPNQDLFIPNDVYPNNGIPFMIIDNDLGPNVQGAYNSNEYLLVIFNRWGGEVFRSTRKDCNGLINGEIRWDGVDNNGNNLQQDNYNGYLVLQNCDYQCKNDEWSSNFFNGLLNSCPYNVRYFNVILVR